MQKTAAAEIGTAEKRIIEMVEEDLKPWGIMTTGAFANAAAVLGLSGSINCIKHLQATALEARCNVDVDALFDEYSNYFPVLAVPTP